MLSTHDFLTHEECVNTRNIVHALREHWVNRASGFLPFYTLGAASYLDAEEDDTIPYYQAVEKYNPILENHFPHLYESLIDTLENVLEMPVSYAKGQSLPGFHIFLSNKAFEGSIASTHFDLQFKPLKWEYKEVDFDHPISFTCPIALPGSSSSGINYWQITNGEAKNLSPEELEKLKSSRNQLFFPYSLGQLILHRGLVLHQIAPSKDLKPEDERITLQGHGLVCDGIMRLYW